MNSAMFIFRIINEESPKICIWMFRTEDMEGGNMKIKSFLFITIFIISFMSVQCSRSQSPFSPEALSNKAVLNGTVILSGTSTASFGAIQVGVKGTSIYTSPDVNGDFQISNLPLGNVVVEFSVQGNVSDIQIDDVQSGEEINITVQVQANNQAMLAHMERNRKFTGDLQVQFQPKKWNLDWVLVNSEDEVQARISGDGHNTIPEDSIEIYGPDGILTVEKTELKFEVGGTYFKVKFPQELAIPLIEDPMTGMEYEITVKGTYGENETQTPFELTNTIEIVGKMPKDSEELSFQVNPNKWNTNWETSSGTVMVKFWGEGFDQIDPATVMMVGPDNDVIYYVASNLADEQLIVKFSKMQAISIIPEPTPGDKHVILITDDLSSFSFEYAIEIVGSKK